ncbi:MAG TPA: hypothetical protein VM936_22130 [Pyrinomonadaceae bacterium]|nr:hypothetical protein [Pyrinomonadaceae bacterium]
MVTSAISNRFKRTPQDGRPAGPRDAAGGTAARGGSRPRDLSIATYFFIAYSVVCFATVFWHCGFKGEAAGTSFIWALASATVGGGFGFLFGIPKILQSDRLPDESASNAVIGYRQQVNTNLTEISDWLTKIIVGLSLINLSKFPPYLTAMAQTLSASIEPASPAPHMAFAYALLVCFSILGFLFGYLYTRLYLQGAFSRADQEAASSTEKETEARVANIETQLDTHHELIMADKGLPTAAVRGNGDTAESASAPQKRRGGAVETLYRMAEEYLSISVADRNERLRRKNDMAKSMFNYAVTHTVCKDMLLREAESSRNEGLTLTLAHYILTNPERGDFERLLRVTRGVVRWHVQYRIVQAIGQLFEKHCAATFDKEAALNVLRQYEANADPQLIRLIQGTRSLIERNTQQESVMAS